jgi:hypothetical protein
MTSKGQHPCEFPWPIFQGENYLAQAREAEERAANCTDPVARVSWLQCASAYRRIATGGPAAMKSRAVPNFGLPVL